MLSNAKGLNGVVGPDSIVRTFKANGTVTKGQHVAYDTAGQTGSDRALYVVQGDATSCTAGFACETVTDDDVRVCTRGYFEGAATDTNVAIDNALVADAAGVVKPNADAVTTRIIAYALETDSGATCDIWICVE